MSLITNTYNQEADFSFSSTMEWVANQLKLKLQDVPEQDFTEDFADDTDHVYDSTLEFLSGKLQHINQRPTGSLFRASFENIAFKANPQDLDFCNGTVTGTLSGGASVSGGALVLSGTANCDWNNDNIASLTQTGCIRILFRTGYDGNAPAVQTLFWSNNSTQNRIMIRLNSNLIQCYVYDNTASLLCNISFVFSAVSGTIYEIELNIDATAGIYRAFLQGTLKDSDTGAGTRGACNNFVRCGGDSSGHDIEILDVLVFDTVQHTSNYTPTDWSEIPVADYEEGYDTLPEMEFTGDGTLVTFDSLIYTFSGDILICLQIGRSGVWTYWNGSAWVTGDGTKDYMCTFANFAANVATLDIEGEVYGQFKIYFPNSYTQGYVDELTASLTVQLYSTSNPTFTLATDITAEIFKNLSITFSSSGSDAVQGVITQAGVDYYWDGSAWSMSDGTYSQSSTIANMQTNIESMGDEDTHLFNFKIFLHSATGLTTPSVSPIILSYYYTANVPTVKDIRDFIEGYCITSTILTGEWIINRRDKFITFFIERTIGRSLSEEETITEYLSGVGKDLLILSRKNITELTSIEYVTGSDVDSSISLSGVELLAEEGIVKSITNITEGKNSTTFQKGSKNVKVTYTVGGTISDDLKEAMIYLCAEQLLGFLGSRTGGGSLSVEGFSRNYGNRGKYQDIRNDLKRQAMTLLKVYTTSVVGSISG